MIADHPNAGKEGKNVVAVSPRSSSCWCGHCGQNDLQYSSDLVALGQERQGKMESSPPGATGKSRPLFPPLMNTLDTYIMETGSDDRLGQVLQTSRSAGKKKKVKKVRKKKQLIPLGQESSHLPGLEEVSELSMISANGRATPKKNTNKVSYPPEDDDDRDNFSLMNNSIGSPHKPITPAKHVLPRSSGAMQASPRPGRVYKTSESTLALTSQQVGLWCW